MKKYPPFVKGRVSKRYTLYHLLLRTSIRAFCNGKDRQSLLAMRSARGSGVIFPVSNR